MALRAWVALAALAAAHASSAAPVEIKLGHVGEPGSLFALSAEEFARAANAKLGDRGRVVVYGSSQLGGDKEMLQKLKLGTLDLAIPSTVMSSEVDAFGLFEMPYLVRDREQMKRIEADIVWPVLAPAAKTRGYEILAVWENGFRQITNSKHPIRVPGDLKGIKLRVPEGKWRVEMFKAYGASPSPMKLSEVFVALQTGVMDGQENPLTQTWSSKLQEVQKFLSLSSHVYTPGYLTAGAKKFASLPKEIQQILGEVGKATQAYVYRTAAEQDRDLLQKFKEAGLKVNEVDRAAFEKASQPIYEQFAKEVANGKDLIERARKAAPRG
ncbi:MAG: TRAP transporter substrate-binding protein [Anaeromyxobacteraceae bacterium]